MHCIGSTFQHRAQAHGDRVALVSGDERVSYGELNGRANRLAHYLHARGVGPGSRVGLHLGRSSELIVAMLAVLKAGGAYVPLDPEYPSERLLYMLEDAGVGVLVSDEQGLSGLPGFELGLVEVVSVDGEAGEIAAETETDPAWRVGGEELAYVMYTSGSTGQPKGVAIAHRGLINLAEQQIEHFRVNADSRVVQFASACFDASVSETLMALLSGGRLFLVDTSLLRSPSEFCALMRDEGINVATLPPSYLATLHPQELPDLESLVVAGEVCPPAVAERWQEQCRLFNAYGPTEASVCATIHRCEGPVGERVSIGRAIGNVQVHLLDEAMHSLSPGATGELYIGGVGIAWGYWGRSRLTAERFVPDPTGTNPGMRLYRTGDRARLLADGQLEFIGRTDEQVKLRGYRIEPGEVEAALMQHPQVRNAAVVARQGDGLVAFLTSERGAEFSSSFVFDALHATLPHFMIPNRLELMNELPLLLNGKIDREALCTIHLMQDRDVGHGISLPRNQNEETLVEAFRVALNQQVVNVTDDFFELGGDSISGITLIAEAERRGISISLEELFLHRTVETIALHSVPTDVEREVHAVRPIGPFELVDVAVREAMADGIEDAYPLSRMQAGMLFHYESRPSAGVYHDIMNFRLHGVLNVEALQRALNEVVARCPVLRTSFDLAAQPEALQLVHRDVAVPLVVADWRSMTAEQQHESLERWNREEIRRGIDVSRAPVLRMYVHWLTDEEFELTISCTHAILDGWSASVVMVMLLKHYHSLLSGNGGLPQAPQPLAFRDYIAMERETLADEGEREFWCEQLEDAQLSQLPRFRQPRRIGETGRVVLELADFDVAAVGAMSRAAKVSIKAVFLALHLKVLSVLTGRADVMTGLLTNGRPEAEGGDQLVGLFLNTVPLHFRFGLGKSWLELFVEIFEADRRCWAHRRYPLAQIMADQGRGQLFDTAFNFTHLPLYDHSGGSARLLSLRRWEYAEFPLVFQCGLSPDGGELHAVLEFDTAVFDRAEMERAARVYETVLQAFSTDLGDVHDRRSNVSKDTYDHAPLPRAYPRELAVHELFAEVALAHGDRVALVSGDERVSYGELNGRANRLAHYLHARGVGPGSRVGLHLGRSSELIVAMLAVLKAGGAYVPLDPEYPSERLLYMLEDAGVGVLVSDEQGLSGLPGFELGLVEVVSVDGEAGEIAAETETDPAWRVGGEELAYVMYTSGSTGQPKGVAIAHRGLINLAEQQIEHFRVNADSRVVQFASACFDASVWETLMALLSGGRLFLVDTRLLRSPSEFCALMRDEGINVATLPPSYLATLHPQELPDLESLVVAGEVCPPAVAERWQEQCRLFNAYGPTEASVCATIHRCEGPVGERVSIGRAIGNVQVHLLDEAMHSLSPGATGELYIGGVGIAWGYWGRSRLTAERFVPDPTGTNPGMRLYRTGDRARLLADGQLEFIGRTDEQVKLRGYRIEPGEVEAALMQHPQVRNAAVVAQEGQEHSILAAYVVWENDVTPSHSKLASYLRERLPPHMVPAVYANVARMPLTRAGKIDRSQLAVRTTTALDDEEYVAPRTELEKQLAALWAEVLGHGHVGIRDNFFDLGGDSLLSIRLKARAEKAGLSFEIEDLFVLQTIEKLTPFASRISNRPNQDWLRPIGPFELVDMAVREAMADGIEDAYPLSRMQAGMLFHYESRPSAGVYHDIMNFRLHGVLNVEALQRALNEVVARCPVLRTSFDLAAQPEALQLVHRDVAVPLVVADWRSMTAEQQHESLERWNREEIRRGIDVSRAPVLRMYVHWLTDEEFELTISCTHAILDGWSASVVMVMLLKHYHSLLSGNGGLPQAPQPLAFRDYIAMERETLADEGEREFWCEQLEDAQLSQLPRFRQPRRIGETGRVVLELADFDVAAVGAMSRAAKVSIKAVFLALHLKVLSVLTGRADVMTGLLTNGRPEAEGGDQLVGLFLNTVPLHFRFGLGKSWLELFVEIFEAERRCWAHRRYPLAQIMADQGRGQLFDTAFNFTRFHEYEELNACESVSISNKGGFEYSNFPLVFQCGLSPDGGELHAVLEFDTAVFDRAEMERAARVYETVLQAFSTDLGDVHDRRSNVSKDTYDHAPLPRAYPRELAVHELFAEVALAHGDRVALVSGDERVSYGELNGRANRLAHYLHARGVGPGSRVGLHLGRSSELIVAMLAVLKAGGAYVPLDPEYPSERLLYMLEDAGVGVLVSDEQGLSGLPGFELGLVEVVSVDGEAGEIAAETETDPAWRVGGEELAYVMYTSGSTGQPKGVAVPHRAIVRLISDSDYCPVRESDCVAQASNACFDAMTFEVYAALTNGARLQLLSKEVMLSPPHLHQELQRGGVTILFVTTALFNQYAMSDTRPLRGLRQVLFGGQQANPRCVAQALARGGARRLLHVYGPTEATTFSTWHQVEELEPDADTVPIGRSLSNGRSYVLDEALHPVPLGTPGELYLGGDGVAHGYWCRSRLTAECFVPDPYAGVSGARMYRTGDRVRQRCDGALEFIGRTDDQVKVRGFRVEPGEVEAALLQHPAVRMAAVVAYRDADRDGLSAYLLWEGERDPVSAELRAFLHSRLPDYMVPGEFWTLAELPLTATGKVDRRALLEQRASLTSVGSAYVAPRNLIEERLSAVWAQILGHDRVGVQDNFFELGGDSILSIQVKAQAQRLGLEFDLQDLFRYQTVEQLARAIGGGDIEATTVPPKTAPFELIEASWRERLSEDIEDAYPLSRMQAGMLFHSDAGRVQGLYREIELHTVRRPFNRDAAVRVAARLCAKHPILRTSFDLKTFTASIQRVHRSARLPVYIEDLRGRSPSDRADAIDVWMDNEKAEEFAWESAPLMRIGLLVETENQFVFACSFHHAILDGWSVAQITSDFVRLYDAENRGQDLKEDHPGVLFRDFIALEQEAIDTKDSQRYWRKSLLGYKRGELPQPFEVAKRSTVRRVAVPIVDPSTLESLAARLRVPLKTVLLAAHLKVMSVITGECDVTTGLVCNGRPESEGGDRVLGIFLNTVPFRHRLHGQTWEQLLQGIFQQEQSYWPHRRYPLPDIKALHGGAVFFDIVFNYTHLHAYGNLGGGQQPVIERRGGFEQSNFPLICQAGRISGSREIAISLEADRSRIADRQLDDIAAIYARVLLSMATDSEKSHAHSSYLDQATERKLVAVGQALSLARSVDRAVHELFAEVALAHGDRVALVSGDERVSYGELNGRANRLAHYLHARGVGPGSRVGLHLGRSSELIVAMLAVLKAGGAYVPLDPEYPSERLLYMLEDAGVGVLVSDEQGLSGLPGFELGLVEVVSVDGEAGEIAAETETDPAWRVGGEELAYVMYTSGSTGQPKGVAVPHRAIVRLAFGEYVEWSETDVLLQLAPTSFDAATFEIWGPLLHAAQLVVAPPGRLDLEQIVALLRDHGVTMQWFTAPLFHRLVDEYAQEIATIGQVIAGGAALSAKYVKRYLDCVGTGRLVNGYGPTENTTFSCCHVMTSWDESWTSVPIGNAIANSTAYVLDSSLHPVPLGTPGELYLGGDGVAHGYWCRSRLTAECFVPDPYAGVSGARMYRTGDRVRQRCDGALEFIGRTDDQVKVRGFRVEPGEVEAALLQHPAVRMAAVVAYRDADRDGLSAYLLWEGERDPVSAELRAFLHSRLPDYMVPGEFWTLAELPLTATGKVDRRALLEQRASLTSVGSAYVAPRNLIEERLSAVWAQILGHDRVGVQDNFFELGGDSILSIQVKAQAQRLGLEFELQDLFRYQTVEQLARAIGGGDIEATTAPPKTAPFELIEASWRERLSEDIEDAYPLSRMQAGMLFHSAYGRDQSMYHDIILHTMHFALDAEVLRRSLAYLMDRHEVLRTSFELIEFGEPLQLVHREVQMPLTVEDMRGATEEERQAHIQSWIDAEKRAGFDWSAGPLFRVLALRSSAKRFLCGFSFHHALLDGWSVGVLALELATAYRMAAAGETIAIDDTPAYRYCDFIALEQTALQQQTHQSFWQHLLQESQPSRIPQLAGTNGTELRRLVLELPAQVEAGLRAVGRSEKVSLKSVLLAAHLKALSVICGRRDVLTGIVSNGRLEVPGGDRQVGLFLNTVPLRVQLGSESWSQLVQRAFDAEYAIWPHRRYSLAAIKAGQGEADLFDVVFNYTHFHIYNDESAPVERSPGGFEHSNYPLAIQAAESPTDGRIHLIVESAAATIVAEQAANIAEIYKSILHAIAEDPHAPHDIRHFAPAFDLQTDHSTPYPRELAVHELFAEVALAHGDRVALVSGDERVSYGELNGRANRLAHYLHARGVGPGSRVGLHLGRSSELIVAMLAVLKAGGAYVPLDPEYPSERLLYMLEDAGVGVLVSDEQGLSGLPGFELGLVEVVSVDGEAGEIAAETETDPAWRVGGEELAYVMYTSGSTGQPKGVAVPHRAIVRLISDSDYCPVRESDCVAQASNACFDAMTFEVYAALTNGARLQLLSKEVMLSPPHLHQELQRGGVTILFVTTALFNQYAMSDTRPLRGLRQVLFGGQQANPRCVAQALARGGARRLLHVYGPTEATTFSTWHQVEELEPDADTVPIGRSLSNGRSYVLDEALHPVPLGTPGELYLGGDGVAHGYWCRSRLTAECFVPDPYAGVSGARMYRTGDRVRQRCDGALEFIGRTDDQVKVRGFRVEPGEVEAALLQHPAVRMAAVVAYRDADRDGLSAYLLWEGERDPVSAELRAFLHSRLPDYMVPGEFWTLAELPLTATGKVDRRALLEQRASLTSVGSAYVAPRNLIEERLSAVWAQILGHDRVGVQDNFFELGGDSILSIQVKAQAQRLGLEFDLQDLFRYHTVEQLARAIGGGDIEATTAPPKTAPFELIEASWREDWPHFPDGVEDAYPVTRLQAGMLVHSELQPDALPFLDVVCYTLRDSFDRECLEETFELLCRQHPNLRTALEFGRYDEPLQLVYSQATIPLAIIDLRGKSEVQQTQCLDQWLDEERRKGFDVRTPPLMRAFVHCLDDRRFQLSLSFHHAIIDGWSESTLITELLKIYAARKRGEKVRLRPLKSQFRDFVLAEQVAVRATEHRSYWRQRMSGDFAHRLPSFEQAAGEPARRWKEIVIGQRNSDQLFNLASRLSVSIRTVLLAVHCKVIANLLGSREIATCVATHGRLGVEDGERVLGNFLNMMPLRVTMPEDGTERLVRAVDEAEMSGSPHAGFPYGAICSECGGPDIETAFNFTHFHVVRQMTATGPIERRGGYAVNNFPMLVNFAIPPGTDGIHGALEIDPDRMHSQQLAIIVSAYEQAIDQMTH